MLCQRLLFAFAVAVSTCGMSRAAANDPLAGWVENGRCPAFDAINSRSVPFARNDRESIRWTNGLDAFLRLRYVYDPKHGIALRMRDQGEGAFGDILLRFIGPPPARALQGNLSRLATTSGIRLGSRAAMVAQKLGKPYIVRGCGLQRYAYAIDRQVGGNSLEFTIKDGRVVEIFQTYGD